MTLLDRFLAKIAFPSSGCWEWIASKTGPGYGQFWDGGQIRLAHRVAYRLFVGPIPEGLTIDHLCRNRACVNPDHLEAVTHRENVLRGEGPSARAAEVTHCAHGHIFDTANTYIYRGSRQCRACGRAKALAAYHRRKAAP